MGREDIETRKTTSDQLMMEWHVEEKEEMEWKKQRVEDKEKIKFVELMAKEAGLIKPQITPWISSVGTVKGLGAALTFWNMKDMCVQRKPDLVFLMETKAMKRKIDRLVKLLKFQESFLRGCSR